MEQFDRLQVEIHQRDAYNWEHQVHRVLEGMGFERAIWSMPIEKLSGGQRNRLLLACVLIGQPDLLILDEPNNHIDVETTNGWNKPWQPLHPPFSSSVTTATSSIALPIKCLN